MKRRICIFLALCIPLALFGSSCCSNTIPPEVVSGFEAEKYLGKWYEIARFEHRFEKGLTRVTAEYSWRDDGKVRVLNRGYDAAKKEWRQAEGKAELITPGRGALKVSFFGPFYAPYRVVELDPQYRWALVSSGEDYLWILSRTPQLPPEVLESLQQRARKLGYDTQRFVWVEQKD